MMDRDAPKLQVRLVGRDGRRRYDPASRDQLVAACSEPGVSVSRLAREHDVNANLVRKWMRKAKEERPLPLASAFVPVQITPDQLCCRRFTEEERAIGQVMSCVQG